MGWTAESRRAISAQFQGTDVANRWIAVQDASWWVGGLQDTVDSLSAATAAEIRIELSELRKTAKTDTAPIEELLACLSPLLASKDLRNTPRQLTGVTAPAVVADAYLALVDALPGE